MSIADRDGSRVIPKERISSIHRILHKAIFMKTQLFSGIFSSRYVRALFVLGIAFGGPAVAANSVRADSAEMTFSGHVPVICEFQATESSSADLALACNDTKDHVQVEPVAISEISEHLAVSDTEILQSTAVQETGRYVRMTITAK